MKSIVLAALLLCSTLLASCEGNVDYYGVIYDSTTGTPIDSVQCVVLGFERTNYNSYSDSLGRYFVGTPLVGCSPDCGSYDVQFTKAGYLPIVIHAPTDVFLIEY